MAFLIKAYDAVVAGRPGILKTFAATRPKALYNILKRLRDAEGPVPFIDGAKLVRLRRSNPSAWLPNRFGEAIHVHGRPAHIVKIECASIVQFAYDDQSELMWCHIAETTARAL